MDDKVPFSDRKLEHNSCSPARYSYALMRDILLTYLADDPRIKQPSPDRFLRHQVAEDLIEPMGCSSTLSGVL